MPSLVAGSPGKRFVIVWVGVTVFVYTVLKTLGGSVPGRPWAISASPDSGPNANMNVCVPFAIVESPPPPDPCWLLIAPFGWGDGTASPPVAPLTGTVVNTVGPLYVGSM